LPLEKADLTQFGQWEGSNRPELLNRWVIGLLLRLINYSHKDIPWMASKKDGEEIEYKVAFIENLPFQ
jgi:hypothetical protein